VLRILVTLVGKWVLRMRVTIEASIAHACGVETARYLMFIYGLLDCDMRNVSCITSDDRSVIFEMDSITISRYSVHVNFGEEVKCRKV